MKKVHPSDRPVLPSDLWTKSEYARHIKKSPTWIDRMIEAGDLVVVKINGNDLVKVPKALTA